MLKIKDNVDLKELEKGFGFEEIKGYPIQYKRKYFDEETKCDMYFLIDSRDNNCFCTKDTYLLFKTINDRDDKYIDDLIQAGLVEKVNE